MNPSQLVKFKTQFDIKGNYNRQAEHQAKKEVYSQEISFTKYADRLTDRQFALKPLQIRFIQSEALQNQPKFKEIQKLFSKYNSQVTSYGERAVNGLHLKTVVMQSMLKFMRMMMLAEDFQTKKIILDISYYWFIKHLNPRSQRTKEQMIGQIRQLLTEHKLLPREIIQNQLPSMKRKQQLEEYRIKARTCYTQFDAPALELENYHTHKVGYMNDREEKKPEDQEEKRRKRLMRVIFKKPNLQQYYQHEEVQPPIEGNSQIPAIVSGQGEVKPPQGEAPQQIQNPQLAAEMEMLNQMGGQPQQPDEALPEEDEQKKKGKLDPFVKVFLMKQQSEIEKKQKSFEHPPINQFQRCRNNYKQQIQRQDQNFQKYMSDWAAQKSRLKTQVSRKIQSMRTFGNKTAALQGAKKIEQGFNHTRISQAIRDGRSYVKCELNKQPLNTQKGLSCFDRRRIKTDSTNTNKPFSQLLQQNKRMNKRSQYLDEIEDIKQKFAKGKIYTSLNAIKKGLMHPEQQDESEKLDKVQYPVNLLSNPFFIVKKKKKKGKKKK